MSPQELNAADGLIFFESRLDESNADYYRALIAGVPASAVQHVSSSLLSVRGPRVVLVAHPWLPPGERSSVRPDINTQLPLNYVVSIPDNFQTGQIVSIALWVPYLPTEEHSVPELSVHASAAIPLYTTGGPTEGQLYTSGRFALPRASSLLRLTPRPGTHPDTKFAAEVVLWSGWDPDYLAAVSSQTSARAPQLKP